jgi:hypothetical protein
MPKWEYCEEYVENGKMTAKLNEMDLGGWEYVTDHSSSLASTKRWIDRGRRIIFRKPRN